MRRSGEWLPSLRWTYTDHILQSAPCARPAPRRQVPEDPYADRAVYVGFGSQVSAPHVHAAALELLLQGPTPARALDIGCGTGVFAALLAHVAPEVRSGAPKDHHEKEAEHTQKHPKSFRKHLHGPANCAPQ